MVNMIVCVWVNGYVIASGGQFNLIMRQRRDERERERETVNKTSEHKQAAVPLLNAVERNKHQPSDVHLNYIDL